MIETKIVDKFYPEFCINLRTTARGILAAIPLSQYFTGLCQIVIVATDLQNIIQKQFCAMISMIEHNVLYSLGRELLLLVKNLLYENKSCPGSE